MSLQSPSDPTTGETWIDSVASRVRAAIDKTGSNSIADLARETGFGELTVSKALARLRDENVADPVAEDPPAVANDRSVIAVSRPAPTPVTTSDSVEPIGTCGRCDEPIGKRPHRGWQRIKQQRLCSECAREVHAEAKRNPERVGRFRSGRTGECGVCQKKILEYQTSAVFTGLGIVHGECALKAKTKPSASVGADDSVKAALSAAGRKLVCLECHQLIDVNEKHHWGPLGTTHGEGIYGQTGTCTSPHVFPAPPITTPIPATAPAITSHGNYAKPTSLIDGDYEDLDDETLEALYAQLLDGSGEFYNRCVDLGHDPSDEMVIIEAIFNDRDLFG